MILATSIGFALERWAGVPEATLFGVALGMLVAMLVPLRYRACRIP